MRLLILAASTAAFFNLYQLQAIYPWLSLRFDASLTQAGWLNMATLFGMMLTAPFASRLTRGATPGRAMLLGLGILIMLNGALALSSWLSTTWLVRLAQGIVLPCVITACVALVASAKSERQRAHWVGCFVAGTILGSTLSRFYPGWALDALGWSGGFISGAALLALAWLVIFVQTRRLDVMPAQGSTEAFVTLLKRAVAERRLAMAFCIGFALLFTQSAIFTVLGLRLAQAPFEQSSAQIGLVYLACLPAIAAVVASPWFYRHRSEAPFFLPFVGVVWLSLGMAGERYVSILLAVGGFSVGTYLLQTLTTRMVSKAQHVPAAFASGLYLSCYYAGGAVGATLAALCFSRWGWPGALALVGAAHLATLGVLLALWRGRWHQDTAC